MGREWDGGCVKVSAVCEQGVREVPEMWEKGMAKGQAHTHIAHAETETHPNIPRKIRRTMHTPEPDILSESDRDLEPSAMR